MYAGTFYASVIGVTQLGQKQLLGWVGEVNMFLIEQNFEKLSDAKLDASTSCKKVPPPPPLGWGMDVKYI